MLIVALAVVVAVACVGGSAARLRRVRRASSVDPATLLPALRPVSRERVGALRDQLPEGMSERVLLEAVLDAPSREHAVAELNEHLSDVGRELAGFGEVPQSAVRISLAAGAFLALIELAQSLGSAGEASWVPVLGAVAAGGVGAGVSAELGRRADRIAKQQREDWNTVVQLLSRLLNGEGPGAGDAGGVV